MLEVGYGSGVLLKTLAAFSTELYAVDFHSNIAPVEEMMKREGFQARLSQGDVLKLDFPDDFFDAVLCYSTLEHVQDTDRAMSELTRVLKAKGTAIIGIPVVSRTMDFLFSLIPPGGGHHDTDSSHDKILASCRKITNVECVRRLPPSLPMFATLYFVCKCRKRATTSCFAT